MRRLLSARLVLALVYVPMVAAWVAVPSRLSAGPLGAAFQPAQRLAPLHAKKKSGGGKKKGPDTAYRVVSDNRIARRNYEIVESIEAGLELQGTEVKSIRNGKVNLRDGFASIDEGNEIWLKNVHIAEHSTTGGYFNHKPKRERKLLMHKKEIRRLRQLLKEKGLTLVPLRMYFNERSFVKVSIGVGRGKKLYDKRESLRRKDVNRMVDRAIRAGMRGGE